MKLARAKGPQADRASVGVLLPMELALAEGDSGEWSRWGGHTKTERWRDEDAEMGLFKLMEEGVD